MSRTLIAVALTFACLAAVAYAEQDAGRSLLQRWDPSLFPGGYGCDRRPGDSPYRLQPSYSWNPINRQICFSVYTVPCANPLSQCCTADFGKLELDVFPTCNNGATIKDITVDGVPTGTAAVWVRYPPGTFDKTLVKLTDLGMTPETANGKTICATLGGTCPSPQQLLIPGDGTGTYAATNQIGPCVCCPVGRLGFYPPPSPSPPSPSPPSLPLPAANLSPPPALPRPFPYCRCNRTQFVTPYYYPQGIAPVESVNPANGNKVFCWSIFANPGLVIDPASRCANTNVYKIELWSNTQCTPKSIARGAVVKATSNGVQASMSWDSNRAVFKVSKLNYDVADTGATTCIELNKNSLCPDLRTFCRNGNTMGACYLSIFDYSQTCCPTFATPVVQV